MKIRDKIRQIYSLYQEYSPLFDDGEELISLELEKFISKVIELLSIEYFGAIAGPVIQEYCVYSCWGEEHSQEETINVLLPSPYLYLNYNSHNTLLQPLQSGLIAH